MLNNSKWLVATVLASTDTEPVHHHRKFYWTLLVKKQVAKLGDGIECGLLLFVLLVINSCYVGVSPKGANCYNEKVKFTERFSF